MATKLFTASVLRVLTDDTGTIMIHFRSSELPANQWYKVEAGTPGLSSFLAIGLTCISTGLLAEAGVEDADFGIEYRLLRRIEIKRN